MKQEAKRPLLLQFIVWMMMTVAVLWSAGAVMAVWHAVEVFDREAVEAASGIGWWLVMAFQPFVLSLMMVVTAVGYAVCRCQYGKIFGLPVVGRAVLVRCCHLCRGLLQPVFPAA